MGLSIASETVPLEMGDDGVVRVGKTRVTLDTLVAAFELGATPEEIVYQYPLLQLADIYAVIGYYLRRRPEVDAYLRLRREKAADIRRQNESSFPSRGVRERLLARRSR